MVLLVTLRVAECRLTMESLRHLERGTSSKVPYIMKYNKIQRDMILKHHKKVEHRIKRYFKYVKNKHHW